MNFVFVNDFSQIASLTFSPVKHRDSFAGDVHLVNMLDSLLQVATVSSPAHALQFQQVGENPGAPVGRTNDAQARYRLGALRSANIVAAKSHGGAIPGSHRDSSDHIAPDILVGGFVAPKSRENQNRADLLPRQTSFPEQLPYARGQMLRGFPPLLINPPQD